MLNDWIESYINYPCQQELVYLQNWWWNLDISQAHWLELQAGHLIHNIPLEREEFRITYIRKHNISSWPRGNPWMDNPKLTKFIKVAQSISDKQLKHFCNIMEIKRRAIFGIVLVSKAKEIHNICMVFSINPAYPFSSKIFSVSLSESWFYKAFGFWKKIQWLKRVIV